MTILNKKLVEEKANDHYDELPYENSRHSFKTGANWAEEQMEGFLEEFGDYVIHETSGLNGASCKLLEQFLKERDEES